MNSIKDQKNLNKKKVLLRLDLNVPLKNGSITDETRINKIIPIFVEIFDPPIIQVIGFFISVVTFFKALISVSNCNPAKDGINFVILLTDACSLCEHEKASLT